MQVLGPRIFTTVFVVSASRSVIIIATIIVTIASREHAYTSSFLFVFIVCDRTSCYMSECPPAVVLVKHSPDIAGYIAHRIRQNIPEQTRKERGCFEIIALANLDLRTKS